MKIYKKIKKLFYKISLKFQNKIIIYEKYQQEIKGKFSKIPLIFQANNYLPTDDIYMELAISNYSKYYQEKIESNAKKYFDNLPIAIQEKKLAKEIRKQHIEALFKKGNYRGYIVLGDPGSGKSTLLKTIAYRSAINKKRYPKYVFHIELKKLADETFRLKKLDGVNIITEYIAKYNLEYSNFFKEYIFDETPYFLIDGWDEIAGDNELSSIVYDSIYKTKKIGNVIVTSRRVGRIDIFEDFEIYEIVELSSRAIRNYILSFAKAQNIDNIKIREELLNNIMNNEALLEMAKNPFLLSLICYLKSKELFSDESYQINSRVELYTLSIEEIRKEFNKKISNREFSIKEQKVLEEFSLELFNYRGKTKHIFSKDDFITFATPKGIDTTLLDNIFLPSKILDVFRDTREIYFIHLTFQEFLTALSLANLSFEKNCKIINTVIQKPSWREVLRFYAGILHSKNKPIDAEKKFEYLITLAWKIKDELGIIESEVAHWFIEANINNPIPPFENLKRNLWKKYQKGKMCASEIFEPILKRWFDDKAIENIIKQIENVINKSSSSDDLDLLKNISFVATSSNIVYQKKLIEIMFNNVTPSAYYQTIASSLGSVNRVELIEFYCKQIQNMNKEKIKKLLLLISYTQDSEYYRFIEPLLDSEDSDIQDAVYECAIKIQAEPFLDNIESFFKKYISKGDVKKFSILYYWEDKKIIKLLNSYALNRNISNKIRAKIMDVMYENMHRESISFLNKDDYLELLLKEDNLEIKKSALKMYSVLVSVTPEEKLKTNIDEIRKEEKYILNLAVQPENNLELRRVALQALKSNKLKGMILQQLYFGLKNLIFNEEENIDIRNLALEVLCEQSYKFKDLYFAKEIFKQGLEIFRGEMLINAIYFIGQYGFKEFINEIRYLAKNGKTPFIKGITIQALGDLQDYESLEFIFKEFKTQNYRYIKEIAVESIIKLEPKILLPYKEDDFVYGELCRYIVESGEILREKEIIIDEGSGMENKKDVFISYASEDRESIVKPLVQLLEDNGISYWYDKQDIGWGDSIIGKISEGLERSKYVVFIITRTFLAKYWTQIELNATLNRQISSGEKKVLPIVVGDIQPHELPLLLQDKKYIAWNHEQEIVDELKKILGRPIEAQSITNNMFSIPMPKRIKKITQLDKDKFIKEVYQGVIEYFEKALKYLEEYDKSIKTDMIKVNELKFIAKIYLNGELKSQCKIWMGGVFGSISYAMGDSYLDINNDNSCNDWLSLEEDEEGLYMKSSGMMYLLHNHDKKIRNPKEAGEYFWKSFIEPLER